MSNDNGFVLPAVSGEALDNLPFGAYVISPDGIIEFFNAKMTEISGVKKSGDVVGQNILNIPTYEQYGLLEYFKKGLRGEPFRIEGIKYVSFVGKKESYRSYYGIPIKDKAGKVLKLLCIVEDITEARNNQEYIKHSLAEKEVLLREINHRVKNNMQVVYSLINLQSLNIKDKTALKLLEESKSQIQSMLMVHEKLYQSKNILTVDFKEYVSDLVGYLLKVFWVNKERIGVKVVVGDGVSLSLDKAIPCALIINELVTNSIKYAFPDKRKGEISVRVRKAGKSKYELCVCDNGVGLAVPPEKLSKKTLGLELVRALAGQINGNIKIINDKGLKITINF